MPPKIYMVDLKEERTHLLHFIKNERCNFWLTVFSSFSSWPPCALRARCPKT